MIKLTREEFEKLTIFALRLESFNKLVLGLEDDFLL